MVDVVGYHARWYVASLFFFEVCFKGLFFIYVCNLDIRVSDGFFSDPKRLWDSVCRNPISASGILCNEYPLMGSFVVLNWEWSSTDVVENSWEWIVCCTSVYFVQFETCNQMRLHMSSVSPQCGGVKRLDFMLCHSRDIHPTWVKLSMGHCKERFLSSEY